MMFLFILRHAFDTSFRYFRHFDADTTLHCRFAIRYATIIFAAPYALFAGFLLFAALILLLLMMPL